MVSDAPRELAEAARPLGAAWGRPAAGGGGQDPGAAGSVGGPGHGPSRVSWARTGHQAGGVVQGRQPRARRSLVPLAEGPGQGVTGVQVVPPGLTPHFSAHGQGRAGRVRKRASLSPAPSSTREGGAVPRLLRIGGEGGESKPVAGRPGAVSALHRAPAGQAGGRAGWRPCSSGTLCPQPPLCKWGAGPRPLPRSPGPGRAGSRGEAPATRPPGRPAAHRRSAPRARAAPPPLREVAGQRGFCSVSRAVRVFIVPGARCSSER